MKVLEIISPVLVMIILGILCRKWKLLNKNGIDNMKALVTNIMLPVAIFHALATSDYGAETAKLVGIMFIMLVVSFSIGFLMKPLMTENYRKYLPFMVSVYEGGSMAYPLYTSLCGQENLSQIAVLDIAGLLFGFSIYMGMKNDLAFIVDTNLFLYEHQSTYNPNMPLRDLLYISSEYQKLVDHRSLYPSILQKIPAPNFIVFYNGTRKKEDRWENLLSEAFEHLEGKPNLELRVVTLNINENHNRELMEQCKILREEEEEKKLREAEYEAGYDSGRQDGLTEGELRKAKETAAELAKLGMASTQIADVLKTEEAVIFQWLEECAK